MNKLVIAAALTLASSAPALADCAGSHAIDRCLIGSWHYASGGSAEWLNRNSRMAHVTGVSHNDLNITMNADGIFTSGQMEVHSHVASNNGALSGEGHAMGHVSGTWSAGGGHVSMCTAPGGMTTKVTVMVHGRRITVTPSMPAHPTSMAYTCNATSLKTSVAVAGRDPIVTVYSRGH